MAIIVGVDRGWLARDAALERLANSLGFLKRADRFHGAFPHWLDGATGRAIRFSPKDDGGDIVETAFLIAGLLAARQYFDRDREEERALREKIDELWRAVEWDWYTQGADVLYWHWSPTHAWAMNHAIRGWNECLVAYVLAAGSPTHAIDPEIYHRGWASGPHFKNGTEHFATRLPLGPPYGGPLFFTHYSFLGIDPRGLKDRYADYWEQNVAHTSINRAHCIANPNRFEGYGARLLGADGKRHSGRLYRALTDQRSRRHLADGGAFVHALFAGGEPRRASLLLNGDGRAALGRIRVQGCLQPGA